MTHDEDRWDAGTNVKSESWVLITLFLAWYPNRKLVNSFENVIKIDRPSKLEKNANLCSDIPAYSFMGIRVPPGSCIQPPGVHGLLVTNYF